VELVGDGRRCGSRRSNSVIVGSRGPPVRREEEVATATKTAPVLGPLKGGRPSTAA
jgi:hypothetical protein